MAFLDKTIVAELHRSLTRGEIAFDEFLDSVGLYFREGVMPTTPPEAATQPRPRWARFHRGRSR